MTTINLLHGIVPQVATLTFEAPDEYPDFAVYLSQPEEMGGVDEEWPRIPRATPLLAVVFTVRDGKRLMTGAFEGISFVDSTILIRVMIPPTSRRKEAEIGCLIARPWESVLIIRG